MRTAGPVDAIDAKLLLALTRYPRATTSALADQVGISRNTAQARLNRLEQTGAVDAFDRRITAAALGYPLTAYVMTRVTQRKLDEVAEALADIPEVLEVHGISGAYDLFVQVVAADGDDLYRVAEDILAIPGVERTDTTVVMRRLVDYRLAPLLRRRASE